MLNTVKSSIKHPSLYLLSLFLLLGLTPWQISHAEITPAYTAPHSNWYDLESRHFHILHDKDDLAIAQKSLKIAEASYAVLSQFFKTAPEGKIYIGLANSYDYSNGFAMITPRNATLINTMPPDAGSLLSSSDWYENVITHELVHIFHLNQVKGIQKTLSQVFGKSNLFSPHNFQPNWIVEGLATYLETTYINNTRTASAYYENLMANEVKKGVRSFASINAGATHWPYNSDYLYGSYFFLFLEETYGRDSVKAMVENYSDNNIPFRIVSNTIPATGKPLTVLWREFTQWLNQRFAYARQNQKNYKADKNSPQTKVLNHTALISSPLSHNGKLYYLQDDQIRHSRIIEQQANGNKRELGKTQAGMLLDSHPKSGILLRQISACSSSKIFSDLYILYPENKRIKRITHCGRYYNAAWMADGERIVAFKKHGSYSSLELLDKNGKPLRTLYAGKPGDNISWISVDGAKDNTHILLTRKIGKNYRFAIQELNINTLVWKTILDDTSVKSSARYADSSVEPSADNDQSIIYTAQAQGNNSASEIFKLNKKTKVRQQLSHFQGLTESPVLDANDNTLYFIGTTAKGPSLFSINAQQQKINAQTKAKQSQRKISKPKKLAFTLPKNVKATLKPYSALKPALVPTSRYPVYLNTGAHKEIGVGLSGQDIFFKHVWSAQLAYMPDLKKTTHAFSYTYDNKIAFSTSREMEENSYHDKAHTQLEKYSLNTINTLEAQHSIDLVGAQFTLGLGLADIHKQGLKKLDNSRDKVLKNSRHGLLGLNLGYNSASLFEDKLGLNDGRSLSFSLESYDVFRKNKDITGLVGQFQWAEYIALGKTTLALKNTLAISRGGKNPAVLKLGGSSSGSINPSSQHIALNRRSFKLRGYAYNAFAGTKLHTASLTWQIPLGTINKTASIPPLGLGKFGFNLFAETGRAWDNKSESYKHALGAELRGELKLGYRWTVPVNFGVVRGLDKKLGKVTTYLNFNSSF